MRWSPPLPDAAARERPAVETHSTRPSACTVIGRRRRQLRERPSRSLSYARSAAPPSRVSHLAGAAADDQHRQLVDGRRHLVGGDGRPAEPRRPHDEIAARLPGLVSRPLDADVRPHAAQDRERARARRVEADVAHPHLGAGHDEGGDGEERRRRRIAGERDLGRPESLPARQHDGAAAGRIETPMCARSRSCSRSSPALADARGAARAQPRQQHGRLHLRTRHRQGPVDRRQPAALHPDGRAAVGRHDARTHGA
jgi:hypothetical protein